MNYFFSLDKQAAERANGSSRLSSHELHVVKITQAYWGVSQGGAKFLALNFVNAQQESADEVKVYFENNAGEHLSGYNQINAILALNGIGGLNQIQGQYKSYDFDAGGVVVKQGLIAPEIVGAYVGIIFSENYYQGQSEVKHTLNVSSVFHHKTTQSPKQFLSNTPAQKEQIDIAIARAQKSSATSKEKVMQQPQNSTQAQHQGQPRQLEGMSHSLYQPMPQPAQNIMAGDDIPF